jgi:hypothetical protein
MKGLFTDATNELNSILSTKLVKRSSILKASKSTTTLATTPTLAVDPDVKTNTDAQEEADKINMFRMAAIGSKEGAAAGISKAVGTDITDATLRTTGRQDFKKLVEYTLYALMWAVIEEAEHPATTDVHTLYVSLCLTKLDFRTKMVVNVERLHSQAFKSNGYGVKFSKDVIVLIIIANIEWAANQDWGSEFRDAMRAICRQHTFNKVHLAAMCIEIMKVLDAADKACDICKAKSPSGMANAVEEGLNYLGALVDSQHVGHYVPGKAYATMSDIESPADKSTKLTHRRGKWKVDHRGGGNHHAHLLPHRAVTKIVGAPNIARKGTMIMMIPKVISAIARNMAAPTLIPTFQSRRATGTRRASRGVLNGYTRK